MNTHIFILADTDIYADKDHSSLYRCWGITPVRYLALKALQLKPKSIHLFAPAIGEPLQKEFHGLPVELTAYSDPGIQSEVYLSYNRDSKDPEDVILVLSSRMPLIKEESLRRLLQAKRRSESTLVGLIRQRDAAQESNWRVLLSGIYCCDFSFLYRFLFRSAQGNQSVSSKNPSSKDKNEDTISRILEGLDLQKHQVSSIQTSSDDELRAISTVKDRWFCAEEIRKDKLRRLAEKEVQILDPGSTYIDWDISVGRNTILYPCTVLEGSTEIGSGCTIRSFTRISDCTISQKVTILEGCVLEQSQISASCRLGPFSHLRPGSQLAKDVHIGNFVELKKAEVGAGTKAMHLAYLGDVEIGEHTNIGAGTITCNYDGINKNKTLIGDHAFIGSDSQLIAPVRVGHGAFVAAGSTITSEVPDDALAIARSRQVNKQDWAKKKFGRKSKTRGRK